MYLPEYYEFCCMVKIVAGKGALEQIPSLLRDAGACRPMVITDKGVRTAGLVDLLVKVVGNETSIATLCDEVPMDSDRGLVNRLAGVYRRNACDALIAVGGGSVLDTAKGVNIVVSEDAEDLMDYEGAHILTARLRPLIAVPTTAGTGSEVTQVAVIGDPETHRKHLFISNFLQPDAAVIDPRMTVCLPPVMTAQTGMDALCHAVEAYTCLGKNPVSDGAALKAVELISRHLLEVVRHPEDLEGRMAMASASCLAGIAFSNSMTGMAHALGHALGGICGVPHGACMAIFLPYALEYNMHRSGDAAGELLLSLVGPESYARTPKHRRAEEVVVWIRQLNQDLHDATGGRHARFLSELRDPGGAPPVAREQLETIAAAAVSEAAVVYNPEELDREDCLMVLEAAWQGHPLKRERIRRG